MTRGKTAITRDRKIINKALKKILKKLKGPRKLRKAINYSILSGGKRLRPILTIESAKASGGNIKDALSFACAVELVHNFSLIHDDLPSMDNDNFRRGKPTCHKKFGEALAILAGDELLNMAFKIVVDSKQKRSLSVISVLSEAIGAGSMIGGQVLDLEYEKGAKKNAKLKNKIDNMKTAALMAASCKIGALAAGAKPKSSKKIYEFGKNLGLAFQVADDIKDGAYRKAKTKEMRKKTSHLIKKAKKNIAFFGKKADGLQYIADHVLNSANAVR